jgi:hypothetical protein
MKKPFSPFIGSDAKMRANGRASAARHRPDRQPSQLTPNFGSWAGRLHAMLGRPLIERVSRVKSLVACSLKFDLQQRIMHLVRRDAILL